MSENIGEAQIIIRAALEELQKSMQEAGKIVQNALEDINKKAVVRFDTNSANIQTQFNGISKVVNEAGEDIRKFSNGSSTVIRELSNQIFGFGTITSAAVTEATTSFAGMGAGASALIAPIGLIVIGVAALVTEVVLVIKFIGDVIEKTKIYIGQNEELTDALNTVKDVLKLVWTGLTDIYDALRDKVAKAIFDFVKGLVETWKEMNNTTGAGDSLLASLKNLISAGFTAVMRIVDSVINIFKAFSGQSDDSKSKVESLTSVVNAMGVVLNVVATIIEAVGIGIQKMGGWASSAIEQLQPVINKIQEILNGIRQIAASGLGSVFGINSTTGGSNTFGDMGPDPGNRSFGTDEYGPGNQAGKNKFYLEQNKTGNTGSRGGGREKEVDLVAEEAKFLNEIVKAHEDQIKLIELKIANGEADLKQRDNLLKTFLEEIESRKLTLSFAENILDAEIKIEDIKLKRKQSLEEIIKLEQESFREIVGKAGKESEAIKNTLNANIDAEQKLKLLELESEGDVQKIEIFNIEEKLRKEIQSVNQSKIAEELKIKLISELEKKASSEIKAIKEEDSFNFLDTLQNGFNTVVSYVGSQFNHMWTSVFGEVNSLFEVLMSSIYQQLVQLATSAIFKTVVTALSGGGAGFLSFLFGGGGYTGDGDEDEPAGIVHRKEFVVSAEGTSIPGNRELLEAMNRGEDVASLIGSYERRSIDSESLRSAALRSLTAGERALNINLGGVSVNAKIQKLTGLNENDWIAIVDDELIPQISKGLKRAGKGVLDNTIN